VLNNVIKLLFFKFFLFVCTQIFFVWFYDYARLVPQIECSCF